MEQLRAGPDFFVKPTPQQRLDELREVTRLIQDNQKLAVPPTVSVMFHEGSVKTTISIPPHFPKAPRSETVVFSAKEDKNSKKVPETKARTKPKSHDLSNHTGYFKGTYYKNGVPLRKRGSQ